MRLNALEMTEGELQSGIVEMNTGYFHHSWSKTDAEIGAVEVSTHFLFLFDCFLFFFEW